MSGTVTSMRVESTFIFYCCHRLNGMDILQEGGSARFTELARKELIKTWHAQGNVAPPAPPASALAIDYLSFFTSDMFAEMSDSCCKTLFFPPGASARLPFDMDMDGEYVQRLRNFVGNRNTLLFNGADAKIIEFINHYFGYKIKQVLHSDRHAQRESHAAHAASPHRSPRRPAAALERRVSATDRVIGVRRMRRGRCRWCRATSGASRSWSSATPPPRPPSPKPTPSKSGCASAPRPGSLHPLLPAHRFQPTLAPRSRR